MKFIISPDIFNVLPQLCVGVVVAKGVDNRQSYPEISAFLQQSIIQAEQQFKEKKVKECAEIVSYRKAFQALNINPNKFLCSIEALFTRIAKGKGMPSINPLVDLNNAVSLAFTLPMGTHNLGLSDQDIYLRFATEQDEFLPFGASELDNPELNEAVYAVGNQVRTRRWTWRQSENGKIDENTHYVFFPIDGFVGVNDEQVRQAAEKLAEWLKTQFHAEVKIGFVDQTHPEIEL
ncbi:B3/B4 domain-containing protein [Actinobacillus vicugnae]|uniref:B3/B4 domain-containing protein n=1 Tax=Actinobacillus vicugnae TaxID=2573093 RepID=UPI0012423A1E|nr:phenylalanine--tRNA ligase beta subunit-related protein [Actinobacillus vicugnae]